MTPDVPAPVTARPQTITITVEQFEAMKRAVDGAHALTEMADGMKGLKEYGLARAADSEARLKAVEAEVMSRGLQLARVERNLVKIAEKLGLQYLE